MQTNVVCLALPLETRRLCLLYWRFFLSSLCTTAPLRFQFPSFAYCVAAVINVTEVLRVILVPPPLPVLTCAPGRLLPSHRAVDRIVKIITTKVYYEKIRSGDKVTSLANVPRASTARLRQGLTRWRRSSGTCVQFPTSCFEH